MLPEVQSGRAKDAVNNSIGILAAIAAKLEHASPETLCSADDSTLPSELSSLVPKRSAAVADAGPSEDFAVSDEALPLLKAGAEWLATQNWPNDAVLSRSAAHLLRWETALRAETLGRVGRAEQGLAVTSASAGVADISAAPLETYLRQRLNSPKLRVVEFRFLPGGRVRQTALFVVEGTTVVPSRLVLQREHPGALTTLTGPGMQFAVLQRVHAAGMKVARPVLLEESVAPLGAAFLITEQLPGKSPVPSMDYWSPPPKSAALAASLARQFALMHSLPIGDLEKVMVRYVDTAKAQTWLSDTIALEQQWQSMAHAPSMAVSAALAWMRTHVGCVDSTESIVHNDALLHNVLAENDEITAVLDWEMAHIGHPFEDLGYVRPVIEQMIGWPQFVAAYVAAGGRQPTQEQTDFFTLRSILKLLIQILYARGAFETGRTNDPNMAEVGAAFLPKLVARLATQLNSILKI